MACEDCNLDDVLAKLFELAQGPSISVFVGNTFALAGHVVMHSSNGPRGPYDRVFNWMDGSFALNGRAEQGNCEGLPSPVPDPMWELLPVPPFPDEYGSDILFLNGKVVTDDGCVATFNEVPIWSETYNPILLPSVYAEHSTTGGTITLECGGVPCTDLLADIPYVEDVGFDVDCEATKWLQCGDPCGFCVALIETDGWSYDYPILDPGNIVWAVDGFFCAGGGPHASSFPSTVYTQAPLASPPTLPIVTLEPLIGAFSPTQAGAQNCEWLDGSFCYSGATGPAYGYNNSPYTSTVVLGGDIEYTTAAWLPYCGCEWEPGDPGPIPDCFGAPLFNHGGTTASPSILNNYCRICESSTITFETDGYHAGLYPG